MLVSPHLVGCGHSGHVEQGFVHAKQALPTEPGPQPVFDLLRWALMEFSFPYFLFPFLSFPLPPSVFLAQTGLKLDILLPQPLGKQAGGNLKTVESTGELAGYLETLLLFLVLGHRQTQFLGDLPPPSGLCRLLRPCVHIHISLPSRT